MKLIFNGNENENDKKSKYFDNFKDIELISSGYTQ